jgi:hypothetical protein
MKPGRAGSTFIVQVFVHVSMSFTSRLEEPPNFRTVGMRSCGNRRVRSARTLNVWSLESRWARVAVALSL